MRLRLLIVLLFVPVAMGGCGDSSSGPVESGSSPSTTVESPVTTAPAVTDPASDTGSSAPERAPDADAPPPEPILELAGEGFDRPIWVGSRPADGAMLVAEQSGRLRDLASGEVVLDLSATVRVGNERGLLGIAFKDDRMFVNYTDRQGDTVISEFPATAPLPADELQLITIRQPASNHNGGGLEIGPDGLLWVGTGDGGRANDAFGHGQDPSTELGAMLRFDVSTPGTAAPAGGFAGARQEVWAIGLRNPWRYTFDSGFLIVADVGQNRVEEVSAVPVTATDVNFGWPLLEGSRCRRNCDTPGLVLPVLEYDHGEGCSITGGVVYRGTTLPQLDGSYLYSDYCSGWIRAASFEADGTMTDDRELFPSIGNVTSFGTDPDGEVYITEHRGSVYRLAGVR